MTNFWTRRKFLTSTSLLAAAVAGSYCRSRSETSEEAGAEVTFLFEEGFDYAPFLMGFQSYSLRHFSDLDSFVSAASELDLGAVELYSGHLSPEADENEIERWKSTLQEAGIEIVAAGVFPFSSDHDANQRIFEFGSRVGLGCLSASPDRDAFESLQQLVAQYDIRVAIHNHGPEDQKWEKPETILSAVSGLDPRIGACVDTGHYLRSEVDPVDAIQLLGDRVLGVHLKDFQGVDEERIVGRGRLDVAATLQALEEVDFDGPLSLEYEDHVENPMPHMREGLAAVQEVLRQWR